MQRARLRAAVDKLHDRPGVLHDDIDDLHLAVRESLAPAMIVAFVSLATRQQLAPGHVFEMTALGDHRRATLRIAQIPGFVETTHGTLGFDRRIFPVLFRAHVQSHVACPRADILESRRQLADQQLRSSMVSPAGRCNTGVKSPCRCLEPRGL